MSAGISPNQSELITMMFFILYCDLATTQQTALTCLFGVGWGGDGYLYGCWPLLDPCVCVIVMFWWWECYSSRASLCLQRFPSHSEHFLSLSPSFSLPGTVCCLYTCINMRLFLLPPPPPPPLSPSVCLSVCLPACLSICPFLSPTTTSPPLSPSLRPPLSLLPSLLTPVFCVPSWFFSLFCFVFSLFFLFFPLDS